MPERCAYCPGVLAPVPVHVGENKWSTVLTSTVTVLRCIRCGREPRSKCWNCDFWTVPCGICNMQRCECRNSTGAVHWLAGKPIAHGLPPLQFERSRRDYAGEA